MKPALRKGITYGYKQVNHCEKATPHSYAVVERFSSNGVRSVAECRSIAEVEEYYRGSGALQTYRRTAEVQENTNGSGVRWRYKSTT